MQHNGDYTTQRYYYLNDRLGSVRLLIDETGAVKNCYTYDPWGKALETQETISNDYCFAGYFWDDETKQYYCVNRYYKPELMRFTSYDSVMGKFEEPLSLHRYLYCENDPINRFDPLGLFYLPYGQTDYDFDMTQNIINYFDKFIMSDPITGPFRAFYMNFLDPVDKRMGEFDYNYGAHGATFKIASSKYTLKSYDFGNYLAGRLYLFGLSPFEEGSRIVGHVAQEGWKKDRTWLDSARSRYWITKGALDANKQLREVVSDNDMLSVFLEYDTARLESYADRFKREWHQQEGSGINSEP
jgi:RHS repeat-associated protein